MKILIGLIATCLLASTAYAATSSYSTFDIDTDCAFDKPASEEEAGMGASGICKIGGKPDIYFSEGDLRQSAGFGANKPFETFGAWNSMNNVIEWRHDESGKIYAAIVRFFIDHPNPDTGVPDKASQGQILLVHKVAQTINDETCVIGLVDARANDDANILARKVADEQSPMFNCQTQEPKYYGIKGEHAAGFSKPMQPLETTVTN